MKRLVTLLAIFISFHSFAQTNGSIIGLIVDENNNELSGITVQIESLKKVTSTDVNGQFFMANLPGGSYTLLVTGVGFNTKKENIVIKPNDNNNISLQLNIKANTLIEVTINARQKYLAKNSSAITRNNVAVKDLPQSVQAVTREVMNEQQLYRVDDALKNVAGVNLASSYGSYNFRGFITNGTSFLTNGMKGAANPEGITASLANIERVEVLRGPSSILYGENAPAGNINFVTKQPKKLTTLNASISGGSFNLLRTQFDITGSLSKNKSLYYVAGYGYESGGRFTNNFDHKSLSVFANLRWDINANTFWQFNSVYNRDRTTSNYSADLPFKEGDLFSVSANFTIFKNDAAYKGNSFQLQSQLQHKLNNNWNLNLLLGLSRTSADRKVYSFGDYVDPATNEIPLTKSVSTMVVPDKIINAYANGIFYLGKVKNNITTGIDFNFNNGSYPKGFQIYDARFLNVVNPDYSPFIPAPDPLAADYYYSSYEVFTSKTFGVYVQDFITISQKLKVLVGLRYNIYQNKYRADSVSYNNFETYEENPLDTKAFIPRLGLVFQPTEGISIYADYNNGFVPQYSNNKASGGPFEPEITNQFEVGLKTDLVKDKLNATLAFYHINKNNVLTRDLNDPNGILLTTIGQVRSKGAELTLTGNIVKGLNAIANYAYNETKITRSNDPDEIGLLFDNNPKHIASLWTTYQFSNTPLKGLKLGVGYRHTSDRFIREKKVAATNTMVLPAYNITDAMVSYSIKRYTLGINANNVFDVRYAQGSYWSRSYFPGMPRNYLVTLGYSLK
ncbi:MAG: TonB-dependent receptor [Ferruginibacter sp.]